MLPYHSGHIYGTWWSIDVGRKGVEGFKVILWGSNLKGEENIFYGGEEELMASFKNS